MEDLLFNIYRICDLKQGNAFRFFENGALYKVDKIIDGKVYYGNIRDMKTTTVGAKSQQRLFEINPEK